MKAIAKDNDTMNNPQTEEMNLDNNLMGENPEAVSTTNNSDNNKNEQREDPTLDENEWKEFRDTLIEKHALTSASVSVAWTQRKIDHLQPDEKDSLCLEARKQRRRREKMQRQPKGRSKSMILKRLPRQESEKFRWKVLDSFFVKRKSLRTASLLLKDPSRNSNLVDLYRST
mmetsp:Transcript_15931/g.26979  ORF Transcript_15931/g.26979 Transcript_15931/m.26979 type:complete len:172 (-) Transcript_15931:104-619(-)